MAEISAIDLAPYVPLSGVLALLSAACLAMGLGMAKSRQVQEDRKPLKVISWWWVLAGGLLIVSSMWGTSAVLLHLADEAGPAKVELRLDAVKTGLTVGAGAAGAIALLLGVRRQWLGERAQAHQEYDAAQKRITELYAKAVDQLGDDSAAVRLGGLYALERVAQANVELRQTIVDVICAYLRMPSGAAEERGAEETAGSESQKLSQDRQDRQVRLTAQRILTKHLKRRSSGSQDFQEFWADIDLDLRGARLVDTDFRECAARKAIFNQAVFEGDANFWGASFEGRVDFWGASFGGADFGGAVFEKDAEFGKSTFRYKAFFWGASFWGGARFEEASFEGGVEFGGAMVKVDLEKPIAWPSGWALDGDSEAPPGCSRLIPAVPLGRPSDDVENEPDAPAKPA
ncbi:hypothetical protein FH608_049465 [Nonomuraea phyllanthi]|uniref:Uncharacterized protein n=1 Tax=Nonomuraea phyllanthi TaxID=2219224 RepID=A0A5C4UWS7_9ACTN|nr:pentapeptide repeat-containing protein [Nonomuraea phyllanthi]KAB8183283.1 hypothetical protein FH608_049465 [Nonomuraea phyllanthi]